MSIPFSDLLSVVGKRVKRTFQTAPDHMSKQDIIRLRFMRSKAVNEYKIFGKPVLFPFEPYWFRHSYKEIFEEQVYRFTPKTAQPYILDCGSNIGLSIIYYGLKYPDAKVVAFEPDPKIFEILKTNVATFGFAERVDLRNQAIWTKEETLQFHSTGGMGGSLQQEGSVAPSHNMVDVHAVRLKDLIDRQIDFLKIDIEGPEILVLEDAADSLHHVENIFVEYHCHIGEEQKLATLLNILKEAGFRYYIRQAYENMTLPFVEKHGAYMDIQLNIFGFRD